MASPGPMNSTPLRYSSSPFSPGSHLPTFENQFKLFSKFGDTKNTGEAITLSNSDKWFRQAKVIDGRKITTTDTGIYFKQVAKTKRVLMLNEYIQFLDLIAKNKKIDTEEIKLKLTYCGAPGTTKTTPVETKGAVSRLTDHTKFTGTHKQRFDETGKGRGKQGREDVFNDSGYVRGYKAAGSYNRKSQ